MILTALINFFVPLINHDLQQLLLFLHWNIALLLMIAPLLLNYAFTIHIT